MRPLHFQFSLSIPIICQILVLGTLHVPSYSHAASQDKLTARIEKEKSVLESLKKEIGLQKQRLSLIRGEENSVYSKLELINRSVEIIDKDLTISRLDLKKNRKKKKKIVKKSYRLRKDIAKTRKSLSKNMRYIYKRGRVSSLKAFFSADGFTDFLLLAKYSQKFAEKDTNIIEKKNVQNEKLKRIKKALFKTEEKIKAIIKNISTKQKNALEEKKEKLKLLRDIEMRKEVYLKHKKEAEQAAEKLIGLLDSLEERRINATVVKKMKTGIFRSVRGRLPWPVKGRIVSKFGKIRNPRFNVYTYNNGIEISSRKNQSIKAVHGGEIIFSDWFRGYGRLVILDNGGGYYTLYGHLSEIDVEVGRYVQIGKVIGKAGETDSIHGNTLYFEIRENGKPVDPLKWLSSKKRT